MKIVYTVWAFLLNLFGVSVFKSCFVDATEDEYDDNLLSGPPITSLIFTTGVYIIISNLGFYPKTFRKPPSFVMFIYEFLVTAFILEFAMACIWTPIDLHIYTTLKKAICKIFSKLGCNEFGTWMVQNKFPMVLVCYIAATGFFIISLYITNAIDLSFYSAHGPKVFSKYLKSKVLRIINTELPDELNDDIVIRRKRALLKPSKQFLNDDN